MSITLTNRLGLPSLHFGITQQDGSRVERVFVKRFKCRACSREWDEATTFTDPKRPNTRVCGDPTCDATCDPVLSESTPEEAPEPEFEPVAVSPALVLEPVRVADFVNVLAAAQRASLALDHFIQLRDPVGADLRALKLLRDALKPFFPADANKP